MGGYRDDHLWETQVRELDEDDSVSVTNINKLFEAATPKLRPRFTFPIGARRIDVIRSMQASMTEFVQSLGENSFDMNNFLYENDHLPTQQAKIAGRTAVASTLYQIWRLIEKELKSGPTASLVKVKL